MKITDATYEVDVEHRGMTLRVMVDLSGAVPELLNVDVIETFDDDEAAGVSTHDLLGDPLFADEVAELAEAERDADWREGV